MQKKLCKKLGKTLCKKLCRKKLNKNVHKIVKKIGKKLGTKLGKKLSLDEPCMYLILLKIGIFCVKGIRKSSTSQKQECALLSLPHHCLRQHKKIVNFPMFLTFLSSLFRTFLMWFSFINFPTKNGSKKKVKNIEKTPFLSRFLQKTR